MHRCWWPSMAATSKDKHFQRSWRGGTIFQRRWPRLQQQARKFLCVSDFVRRRLLERGVRDEILAVHHLGVVMPPMPTQDPVPSNRLLTVGRFVAKKGSLLAKATTATLPCTRVNKAPTHRPRVPHGHWNTTTLTAGLRRSGMIAPMVLDGPMDGAN